MTRTFNHSGRDSRGNLTVYALACGSVDRRQSARHGEVSIWREHGVYHVRAPWSRDGRKWESFDKVSDARKTFREWVKAF